MATALKPLLDQISEVPPPLSRTTPRPWLSTLLILSSDLAALTVAMGLGAWLTRGFRVERILYSGQPWTVLAIFVCVYALFGMYPGVAINVIEELRRATEATTIVYLVLGAFILIGPTVDARSVVAFVAAWVVSLVLVPLARSLVRHLFGQQGWWGYPVLVFGGDEPGLMLARRLQQQPELGFRPAAVLDAGSGADDYVGSIPVLQGWHRAPAIARQLGISRAIVSAPGIPQEDLLELIDSHASDFSHLMIVADLGGVGSLGAEARDFCRELTLEVRKNLLLPGPILAKRVIDIGLALVLAVLGAPTLPL